MVVQWRLLRVGIFAALTFVLCDAVYKHKNMNIKIFDSGMADKDGVSRENYLFAHGLAENHSQANWYVKGDNNAPYLIDGRLFTFDFPDATEHFWRVNFTQTSLGQGNEIRALQNAYEHAIAHLDDTQNKDIVLLGMSRGATAIVSFLGLYKPKRVKAAVIESPFDSTEGIIRDLVNKNNVDGSSRFAAIAHKALCAVFWKHSCKGEQAIDFVFNIDKNVPLLLIASRQDKRVPLARTQALYDELKKTGHTKVHFFVCDEGAHGRILQGPCGHDYQCVVHAFYKKYGLAHDPALAALGEPLLDAAS